MTTLKEIASLAGVHVSTASAILNAASGNTRVSADTRQRVLSAAKKLSYVPNESARRLRRGRSEVVGFLGGDLRNPFFAELTAALEEELAHSGLQLMVSHIAHPETTSLIRAFENLRQQGIQNIICWEESAARARIKEDSVAPPLPIGFTRRAKPGVWLDLETALALSVDELIQHRFKRLGFFAPQKHQESPSVNARCSVFTRECNRRGLPPPTFTTYTGESWNLDAALRGAQDVLKTHPDVEAWVGFNDIAALALLAHFPRKNSSRVVCFDGTAMARCWPGKPPYLDLKIRKLAQMTAMVIRGEQSANDLGKRENWLRPSLVNQAD